MQKGKHRTEKLTEDIKGRMEGEHRERDVDKREDHEDRQG